MFNILQAANISKHLLSLFRRQNCQHLVGHIRGISCIHNILFFLVFTIPYPVN